MIASVYESDGNHTIITIPDATGRIVIQMRPDSQKYMVWHCAVKQNLCGTTCAVCRKQHDVHVMMLPSGPMFCLQHCPNDIAALAALQAIKEE